MELLLHLAAGGGCSTYLGGRALVASILQQVSHHLQVVLLSSHVERGEAILQERGEDQNFRPGSSAGAQTNGGG